ncbi:hypothetical protein LAV_00061 [Sphingobium phage Lacusarx]|uniref:Uncharacterized protein n=1 Tax=Sphingobium phage Lacusarx TaxID=1980139 RepID=A0A1W6DX41_9CAUD|nr:hypothetical protein FDH44_gp061 [Sphingobium phage Lacusarx]ARK07461.1 hypothetical protein LAV_00061 [Sphingobium phage Lacusarx]
MDKQILMWLQVQSFLYPLYFLAALVAAPYILDWFDGPDDPDGFA